MHLGNWIGSQGVTYNIRNGRPNMCESSDDSLDECSNASHDDEPTSEEHMSTSDGATNPDGQKKDTIDPVKNYVVETPLKITANDNRFSSNNTSCTHTLNTFENSPNCKSLSDRGEVTMSSEAVTPSGMMHDEVEYLGVTPGRTRKGVTANDIGDGGKSVTDVDMELLDNVVNSAELQWTCQISRTLEQLDKRSSSSNVTYNIRHVKQEMCVSSDDSLDESSNGSSDEHMPTSDVDTNQDGQKKDTIGPVTTNASETSSRQTANANSVICKNTTSTHTRNTPENIQKGPLDRDEDIASNVAVTSSRESNDVVVFLGNNPCHKTRNVVTANDNANEGDSLLTPAPSQVTPDHENVAHRHSVPADADNYNVTLRSNKTERNCSEGSNIELFEDCISSLKEEEPPQLLSPGQLPSLSKIRIGFDIDQLTAISTTFEDLVKSTHTDSTWRFSNIIERTHTMKSSRLDVESNDKIVFNVDRVRRKSIPLHLFTHVKICNVLMKNLPFSVYIVLLDKKPCYSKSGMYMTDEKYQMLLEILNKTRVQCNMETTPALRTDFNRLSKFMERDNHNKVRVRYSCCPRKKFTPYSCTKSVAETFAKTFDKVARTTKFYSTFKNSIFLMNSIGTKKTMKVDISVLDISPQPLQAGDSIGEFPEFQEKMSVALEKARCSLTDLFPVLRDANSMNTAQVYYDFGCTIGCHSSDNSSPAQYSTLSSLTHDITNIKSYLKPNDLSTSKGMSEMFPLDYNRSIFKRLMSNIQLCDKHIHTCSLIFHNSLTTRSLFSLFGHSESVVLATKSIWSHVVDTGTIKCFIIQIFDLEGVECNIDPGTEYDEEYDDGVREKLKLIFNKYNADISVESNLDHQVLFVYTEIVLRQAERPAYIQPKESSRFHIPSKYTRSLSREQLSVANLIYNIVWSASIEKYAQHQMDYLEDECPQIPPRIVEAFLESRSVPSDLTSDEIEDLERYADNFELSNKEESIILADRLDNHMCDYESETESCTVDRDTATSTLHKSLSDTDITDEELQVTEDVTSDTHLEQVLFNYSHASKYRKLFLTEIGNIHTGNARITAVHPLSDHEASDEEAHADPNPGYSLEHPDGTNILGFQIYTDPLKEYEGKNQFTNWDALYSLPTYMTAVLHDVGISPIFKDEAKEKLIEMQDFIKYMCHDFISNMKINGCVNTRVEYFMKYSTKKASVMTTIINPTQICRIVDHKQLTKFLENKINLYVKPLDHFISSIIESKSAVRQMSQHFRLSPEAKTFLFFCSDIAVHQFGSSYQSSTMLKEVKKDIEEEGHIHLPLRYRARLSSLDRSRTHLLFGAKSMLLSISTYSNTSGVKSTFKRKEMPESLSVFRELLAKHMKKQCHRPITYAETSIAIVGLFHGHSQNISNNDLNQNPIDSRHKPSYKYKESLPVVTNNKHTDDTTSASTHTDVSHDDNEDSNRVGFFDSIPYGKLKALPTSSLEKLLRDVMELVAMTYRDDWCNILFSYQAKHNNTFSMKQENKVIFPTTTDQYNKFVNVEKNTSIDVPFVTKRIGKGTTSIDSTKAVIRNCFHALSPSADAPACPNWKKLTSRQILHLTMSMWTKIGAQNITPQDIEECLVDRLKEYGRENSDSSLSIVWRTQPRRMISYPRGVGLVIKTQDKSIQWSHEEHDFISSTPKNTKRAKKSTYADTSNKNSLTIYRLPFSHVFQIDAGRCQENYGYFMIMKAFEHQKIPTRDLPFKHIIMGTNFSFDLLYDTSPQYKNAIKNATKKFKRFDDDLKSLYNNCFYQYKMHSISKETCFKKLVDRYRTAEDEGERRNAAIDIMSHMGAYWSDEMASIIAAAKYAYKYVAANVATEDTPKNWADFWTDVRVWTKVDEFYRKQYCIGGR